MVSKLTTQNQASSNASMTPARVNSNVCAPNTSFGILENGQLRKINTANGSTQNLGSTNLRATYPLSGMNLGYGADWARKEQVNGLGVTRDGNTFYAFRGWSKGYYQNNIWVDGVRSHFDLFKYDANGNNPQRIPITENGRDYYQFWELSYQQQNMDLIAGAVNPADGRYYFGGFHQENNGNGRYNLYFALRSVDPKDGRLRHIAKVFVESKAGPYSWDDANGDIVFDHAGNFHLLFAKQPSGGTSAVKLVTIPESWLPVDSNTPDMPKLYGTSTVTRYISGADGVANSLSVDSDGQLIIATVRTAFKYDPTSFVLDRKANSIDGNTGLINTDLASCHTPPTLEVKKNVVERAADNDQFRLTADDQAQDSGIFAEATTSGNKTGVQEQQIGPAIVRFGGEYIINEEMAAGSTSKLNKYDTTLSCEASYPQGGTEKLEPTPVSGQQYKVTIPERSAKGPANVSCIYTNTPVGKDPVFKVKKDSAEAGATAADGEWMSAYTVTVTNDGEIAGTSKAVTDTPSVPEGFELTEAKVDGETVELVDGSFTVTDGVKLAAGENKVFEVVLSGTYEAGKADWVAVGECELEGEGNPAKGLFNKVTMEEDSDGPENNDACNPVSKDSAEAGATAADGEWTSAYTVTVTNDGEIAGTSKAVTDTPSVPEGFELTEAKVDGETVELVDGSFTVTDGVKLAAGENKVFEVVLSGTYEAGKADWVAVGECELEGEGNPAKGLFNKVTMEEDSDGPENNDACNPVSKDPSFKVKKDSAEAGATAADGEWTSAYTVTVTNDGEIAGTSKAVTDTPSVPAGFELTEAKVDGETVELVDGSFTVTDGVKLAAGENKVFEVVLSGTYEAGKADWVAVGECELEGEGNPAKGLFNKVTMEEDSDGPENNDACNPVSKDPSFKVKKDSAEAGAKAENGEWTSAYTVTVTNDGEIAGTSKAVTDTPSVPEGFTVTGATVDGEAVEITDGTFTVTDGVKLAAGEDKVFEVVLSGTYEAGKADWVAVGECETEGEGNPDKGLFNKVTMEDDSDGPENNDACNPVGKDPSFAVKKDADTTSVVTSEGKTWKATYTVTVSNTGDIAGTSQAVTDTPSVPKGFAVTGATVDGEAVEITDGTFTVTEGVKLAAGQAKTFTVTLTGDVAKSGVAWLAVAECELEGEGNPAKGLFNKVAMEGDSDGPENNDACVPVVKEGEPIFKVKKNADTKSVSTAEGKTWQAVYSVTVSNAGDAAGTSKAVIDTPSVPEGFTVTGAEVDGKAVEITDGSFTVTEGVKLKAGKAKTFTVTLIGDVAKSGVDWAAAAECELTGEGNPAKGLFNKVAMENDSDGPDNNDACVPVVPPAPPEGPGDLSKTGADVLGIIGAGAGLLMLAGAMLVWRRRAAEH
nr:DUF11 domain-containing protein [Pseudoglutamicibacter albus]